MTEWRPVVGFEGRYEVSACGRVRRCARTVLQDNGHTYQVAQKELSQVAAGHRRGYLGVGLKVGRKTNRVKLVHRLVASAFVANPDNLPDVNHKNLDKHDNSVGNLEWVSKTANQEHAAKRGRFHGQTNPKARFKLAPCDVESIHEDLRTGRSQWQVAERHGISQSMVSMIKTGKSWADPAKVFAHVA